VIQNLQQGDYLFLPDPFLFIIHHGPTIRSYELCASGDVISLSIPTASVVKWSEFLATDPEVRVRFPALPDFLRGSGSGTGSNEPREYKLMSYLEERVTAPIQKT
jgi:hypothetical protein